MRILAVFALCSARLLAQEDEVLRWTSIDVVVEEERAVVTVDVYESDRSGHALEDGSIRCLCGPAERPLPPAAKIARRLEEQRVGRLAFDRHPINEVVEFLRDNFDVEMMLDRHLARGGMEGLPVVSMEVSDVSLRETLERVASASPLGYAVVDGVIVFGEREAVMLPEGAEVQSVEVLDQDRTFHGGDELEIVASPEGGRSDSCRSSPNGRLIAGIDWSVPRRSPRVR